MASVPKGCKFCKKVVAPSSLWRHEQGCRQNPHKKDFVCGVCGSVFCSASAKVIHERSHNRARPSTADVGTQAGTGRLVEREVACQVPADLYTLSTAAVEEDVAALMVGEQPPSLDKPQAC